MDVDRVRMAAFYESEMSVRRDRPLEPERHRLLAARAEHLRRNGNLRSLLEVGCGAGRDGPTLATAVHRYVGVDTSLAGVKICRQLGLESYVASATALPFRSGVFDAAWSMSTLMHLPDREFTAAIVELRRVCRGGAEVVIGLWGADTETAFVDRHGRYFHHRTDEQVRDTLSLLGAVSSFTTWGHCPDGGHYQCVLVVVA